MSSCLYVYKYAYLLQELVNNNFMMMAVSGLDYNRLPDTEKAVYLMMTVNCTKLMQVGLFILLPMRRLSAIDWDACDI